MKGTVKLLASKAVKMKQYDGLISLTMPKGEEAILYTGTKPASFEVAQLPLKVEECNSWGVNKK